MGLEKITCSFKNGAKKAELERDRNRLSNFSFRKKDEATGELTNFFEGIKYEEISKEIEAIHNPKGFFQKIFYKLGYNLYENGVYIPKD